MKYYFQQPIKNPIKYYNNFQKQWKQSVFWAKKINEKNNKLLNFKARPEMESFNEKYINQGRIAKILVNNYFISVANLVNKILQKQSIFNSLEIGCGEGFSTKRLNDLLPINIDFEASEYVSKQIIEAQKRNPFLKIIEENVYKLKRNDNSIDLIFLLEVLEHLDYPELALKEINRVSSENGYLIIGVPREPLWRILNMSRFKYIKNFGNTPGHLNHWSTKRIIKLVEQNYGSVVAFETPLPWTIILAKSKKN